MTLRVMEVGAWLASYSQQATRFFVARGAVTGLISGVESVSAGRDAGQGDDVPPPESRSCLGEFFSGRAVVLLTVEPAVLTHDKMQEPVEDWLL